MHNFFYVLHILNNWCLCLIILLIEVLFVFICDAYLLYRQQIMSVERKYISWTEQHNNWIVLLSAIIYNNVYPHRMQSSPVYVYISSMTL